MNRQNAKDGYGGWRLEHGNRQPPKPPEGGFGGGGGSGDGYRQIPFGVNKSAGEKTNQ